MEFGARTQVLHSLSTDYPSIRRKIGKSSEFMFVRVNILGNVLDSFPCSRLFYVTYSVFRLDAAKCISESGDGELDYGKQ